MLLSSPHLGMPKLSQLLPNCFCHSRMAVPQVRHTNACAAVFPYNRHKNKVNLRHSRESKRRKIHSDGKRSLWWNLFRVLNYLLMQNLQAKWSPFPSFPCSHSCGEVQVLFAICGVQPTALSPIKDLKCQRDSTAPNASLDQMFWRNRYCQLNRRPEP